jgi:hypothetical protein
MGGKILLRVCFDFVVSVSIWWIGMFTCYGFDILPGQIDLILFPTVFSSCNMCLF